MSKEIASLQTRTGAIVRGSTMEMPVRASVMTDDWWAVLAVTKNLRIYPAEGVMEPTMQPTQPREKSLAVATIGCLHSQKKDSDSCFIGTSNWQTLRGVA